MRSATVYNFLIEANIMAIIAIVLMLLVRKFLRAKLGNRVIWFAWLLVAIRLLCPLALPNPAINEIRPTYSTDQGIRPMADQVRVRFRDGATNAYHTVFGYGGRENNPVAKTTWNVVYSTTNGRFSKALLWVYLGGALGVLGYMVFQNARFRRRLKKNRIEKLSGEMLEQYLSLSKERGTKPVPVYLTDPLPSACLVGVFRPFIVLPLSTPPKDMKKVLIHESCHLKGHDNLWGVVRNLCCIIHWFNPLVWWAAAMSRTDCELKCDDRVIEKLDKEERVAYANMLVLASAKRGTRNITVLATCMSMTGRQMKQRINTIVNSRRALRWLTLSFASLALVAFLFAFATAEYAKPISIPDFPEAVEGFAGFQTIATKEDAIRYTKEFLGCDAVGADTEKLNIKADQGDGMWYINAFAPAKALPYRLAFDAYGMIVSYANGTVYYANAYPAASPITDSSEEGIRLLQYVTAFCDAMLPGVSSAFEVIRIDADAKNDDGRYLTITTGNGRTRLAHSFIMQIEPVVRVLAFEPMDEISICFNRTGNTEALSAYTQENATADCRAYMTEVTGFSQQQVDSGTITAAFFPEDMIWAAGFTIAADQVNGVLLNTLREAYGPGSSFTIEVLLNQKGTRLEYKSLYAFQHRNDLIITREQAQETGLQAVSQTLGVKEPTSNVVDYYADRAEYHVYYNNAGNNPWGTAHVDAHTGETKLIVNRAEKGEAQFIAPKVQTSVTPILAPEPAAGSSGINNDPDVLESGESIILEPEATVAPETPREGDLTKEQAVALARKAIMDQCGLDEQTVNALTMFNARYLLKTANNTEWGIDFKPPYWSISFSLNDPRTPFDYAVILDAVTGEILMLRDPSNLGVG